MTASQLITPALSFDDPTGPTPPVTLTTGPIPTSRRSEPFSRHAPCSPGLRALNWLALHACPAQTGRDGATVGGRAARGRVLGQVRRAMCSKERSE